MPKVLITGGAGFIGSHVSRECLKLGFQVVVLDDLSGGFKENIPEEALFVEGSILDHALLEKLFKQHQFDYVYHFAAYAAEGLSHFIKRFNYENNLVGSVNLINESVKNKIKCFVFTSSIAVYGSQKPPLHEDLFPQPEDPYGIAKFAVEQELKVTHELFGLPYLIFRPHNVYGEFQNLGDKYRNVVGIFMNQLMQGKELSVFGDGSQTRAFSYIGDMASIMASSVFSTEHHNTIFNIGADQEYSVKELANAVIEAMELKSELRHLPERVEAKHAYSDHKKIKKAFGDQQQTDLKTGLKKMAIWAKKTGIKSSTKFEGIEIQEKLPPFWLE